uniref:Uncharacterized protein n=1 Tax=Rhizophora mucronata TaxID=61149 RepID=A0A2P2N0H6_RHIMU
MQSLSTKTQRNRSKLKKTIGQVIKHTLDGI